MRNQTQYELSDYIDQQFPEWLNQLQHYFGHSGETRLSKVLPFGLANVSFNVLARLLVSPSQWALS